MADTNGPIDDPVASFQMPRPDRERPDVEPVDSKVDWAVKQINSSREQVGKWIKQAKECDDFAAGRHFPKADFESLKAEGRPTAAFNAAQKWLRFISGVERAGQIETRCLPRDMHSDPEGLAADVLSKAIEWAVQGCKGDKHRSRAFADMIRRGMGWTNTLLNRLDDVSGKIEVRRIDGMEMLWDPDTEEENLEDARWVARERQLPRKEVILRWPEARAWVDISSGTAWDQDRPGESVLRSEKIAVPQDASAWPALKKGHVKVIEFQWKEEMPGIYFYDPFADKDEWLSEKEFDRFRAKYLRIAPRLRAKAGDRTARYDEAERAKLAALPDDLEHDRVLMNAYRSMLIIGRKAVAESTLPGQRFTYNCMTGQWDDSERIWYPFFKILIDPQRYMTKFANQIMEVMTRSPKGGVIAELGAVRDPQQFEQEYAKPGSVSVVEAGAIAGGKIKDKPMPQLPQGSVEMFQVCQQLMREVTGINPEIAMGMGAGDQPALTMQQRQGAGMLLLSQEFSALTAYRENEARTIVDFLKLIADDRWIRVGGPYDAQSIQLIKAPFYMEYDVVLDEGTRDPQVRQAFWRDIKEMGPMLAKMGVSPADFFDYAPLPASDRIKWKQSILQQQEQRKQMAMQGITDGGRGKPVSITEVKTRERVLATQAMLNEAKAAKLAAEAKNAQGKSLIDAIIKGMDTGVGIGKERLAMARDERKAQLDERKQNIDTGQQVLGAGIDLMKAGITAAMKPNGKGGE